MKDWLLSVWTKGGSSTARARWIGGFCYGSRSIGTRKFEEIFFWDHRFISAKSCGPELGAFCTR